uniref:TBC1 domain-containing protein n=1 Tax=Pseudonaja textilis TaxID=8673 RepID=A0A670ZCG1_PSETE
MVVTQGLPVLCSKLLFKIRPHLWYVDAEKLNSGMCSMFSCAHTIGHIRFRVIINGTIPKESMISAVLINKSMRKALKGREIKVDLPCQENAQDSSPWRIHLGIHRLGHHHGQPCDNVQNRTEHSMWSCEESLDSSEPAIAFSINEENSRPPEETVSSDSTRTSVTSICDYSSLNISASKPVPSKLSYYPFPQKKNPKISEAARKLGLYVSQ